MISSNTFYRKAYQKQKTLLRKNKPLFLSKIFIGFILFYKACTFFSKGVCRYHPTCSNYAIICFKQHNFVKAFWLSFLRILSCNPIGKRSFFDFPPENRKEKTFG